MQYNLIAEIKPDQSGTVVMTGSNPELLIQSPGVMCNVDNDMIFEKATNCYIEIAGEMLKHKQNFAIEMHLKNGINSSHSFNTLFACENINADKSENEFGILYANTKEIKLSSWNSKREHNPSLVNSDLVVGNWNHVTEDYHTLKVEVCNKVLKVFINDVMTYSGAYENEMQTDFIYIGQEPDKRSTPNTPNFDATQSLYAFVKWIKFYDIVPPSENLEGVELGYYENPLTALDNIEVICEAENVISASEAGLRLDYDKHMILKLTELPQIKDFLLEFTVVGGSHSKGSIGFVVNSKQLEPISDTFGNFMYIDQDSTYNNYIGYGKGSNTAGSSQWTNYNHLVTLGLDKTKDMKVRMMFVNNKMTVYVNDMLVHSEIYLNFHSEVELYDLAIRCWNVSATIKDLKVYSPEILSEVKNTFTVDYEEVKADDSKINLVGSAVKGYRNDIALTPGTSNKNGCVVIPNFFSEARDVEVHIPLTFDSPNSNEGGDSVTIQMFAKGDEPRLTEKGLLSEYGVTLQHMHWRGYSKGQTALFVEYENKNKKQQKEYSCTFNDKPRCINLLTVKYINQELIYELNGKLVNKMKCSYDSNFAKTKDLVIKADCGGVYQKVTIAGFTYRVLSNIHKERFLLEDATGLKKPVLESSETISVSNVPIRYIRDYLAGNNKESNSHWFEVQAINGEGINIARHKEVKAFTTGSYNESELLRVTDEDTSTNFFGITSNNTECFVEIDLGHAYKLSMVKVWHYHKDSRVYNNTKTEVSHNGEDWIVLFDSAISGTYTETASGKTHNLAGINVTKETYALEAVIGEKNEATFLEHGLILEDFNKGINGCNAIDSTFKIIAYSDNDALNKSLRLKGLPNDSVVKYKYDIDYSMAYVKGIESISATYSINNNSTAKVAFSFDSGSTWKSFSGDTFIDIDITNITEFNTNAISLVNFSSLNATQIGMLYEPKKIRFAYCISKDNYLDILNINKLEIKYIVREN